LTVADPAGRPAWFAELEVTAPDALAAWWGIADERPLSVRREVRRRAGAGSVARVLAQHEAIADAYALQLRTLPGPAFLLPGGEGDWNVAQTLGHAFAARDGLAMAASLAAQGRFPPDAPRVVPGVPGPAAATRDDLQRRLTLSRKLVARAARGVAGHELDACPLEHPLVGRMRCGEWLLFAGVHDLMHLEQLEALERELR
jgi:hypothetical protein